MMAPKFVHELRPYVLILFAVSCLLATGCITGIKETPQVAYEQAQVDVTDEGMFAEIGVRIQEAVVEEGVPGMAVAVARDGEILWERGFGWADRERRVPATAHTPFSLASVSKPFTATGLMVLVQQGKIDLDAPVNRYLPKDCQLKVWIGDPDEVTIRRLANHTAGLPRHENYYEADEMASKPSMEESIRRFGNVVMLPGERYRYSNFGYGILDYVIECVSGKSFPDFMRTEVFVPLNMTRSSVGIGPGLEPFAAKRYDGSQRPIPFYNTDHPGASDVYASAHDLVLFGMFHLGQVRPDQKAILSDEVRLQMQVPKACMHPAYPPDAKSAPGFYYGIGWNIDEGPMGKGVSHSGGMGGVTSRIMMLPDEGIVIAAVANNNCRLPWLFERDVLRVLLPDYAEKRAEWRRTRRQARSRNIPGDDEEELLPKLMGDWEGEIHTYAGTFPMTMSFLESGDIHAQIGGQFPALVSDVRCTGPRFEGRMQGRIFTPDSNSRRPVTGFQHLDLDLTYRGDVLNGYVVAIAGNALSYWVELKKRQPEEETVGTAGPEANTGN